MTAISWRIRLSARAESDFRQIIAYTRDTFGASQAMAYRAILRDALVALEHGPNIRGSIARDEIFSGIRSYHVARRGHRGRHLILYRAAPDHRIDAAHPARRHGYFPAHPRRYRGILKGRSPVCVRARAPRKPSPARGAGNTSG